MTDAQEIEKLVQALDKLPPMQKSKTKAQNCGTNAEPSRPSALESLFAICDRHGYQVDVIISRWRDAETVVERHHVAQEMRKLGFSYPEIGAVMLRDQSTIQYMCKTEYKARRKALMLGRYHCKK